MEQQEMLERIRQKTFFKNNGLVLKTVHLLQGKYIALTDVCYVLEPSMTESDFLDAVNYLAESGYLKLRHIRTRQHTTLADASLSELEAKVSAAGIQIIACARTDACVDV